MELILERISKRYGAQWALHELSLRCGTGMLGLVGPNGAGKTSLMRLLATLVPPTSGTARWNGKDIQTEGQALRRVLGYLPQEFGVYPEFSARQFLRYLAALKGLPAGLARRRSDEVLELVNLEAAADRKLRGYSGGMRQRLGIAPGPPERSGTADRRRADGWPRPCGTRALSHPAGEPDHQPVGDPVYAHHRRRGGGRQPASAAWRK